MSNRDLAVALVNKYAPSYRVVFQSLSSSGEVIRGLKGLCDDMNKIIYFDPMLVDHASPIFVQIFTAHELGHTFSGVAHAHDANWRKAVEQILIAEGLGQYAHPKYYRATAPAALWKLHVQYEVEKGRPRWLKLR